MPAQKTPAMSLLDFRAIAGLINRHCGLHFEDESLTRVARKLSDRLQVLGLQTFGEYRRHLEHDANKEVELNLAAESLATFETYFFRNMPQLESLLADVLPALKRQAEARGDEALTIWSVGCASGEEAYTVAVLLADSGLFDRRNVRVYGGDLSRAKLEQARAGTYGRASFRALPERYDRYFVESGTQKTVHPSIQSMCEFAEMNVLDGRTLEGAPQPDVVLCRNVLIYFDEASRELALRALYQRLRSGGYLLLGHSESLFRASTSFELDPLPGGLVYRRP